MLEDVSPGQAMAALRENPQARLLDVRTPTEWRQIGLPDLSGIDAEPVLLAWQNESGQGNPDFIDALASAGLAKDQPLYMLCRSGVRSIASGQAAIEAGYTCVFNVVNGFEGPPDQTRQRGRVAGWQADGLPWSKGS